MKDSIYDLVADEPPSAPMPPRTQHTPGPWVAYRANPLTRDVIYINPAATPSTLLEIATVYTTGLDEAEANARLIAAAPDLLEACEYIATRYFPEIPAHAMIMIRAAIRKARGKA